MTRDRADKKEPKEGAKGHNVDGKEVKGGDGGHKVDEEHTKHRPD